MIESDQKELRRIQGRLYAKYAPKLKKKVNQTSAIKEVVEICLTKERHRFTEEKLKDMQALLDSGELDHKTEVYDEKVAEEYEKEMAKEIDKAIKEGRLSHPDDDPKLKELRKQYGDK